MFSDRGITPKLIYKLVTSLLIIVVMIITTSYFTFTKLRNIEDHFNSVITGTTPAIIALNQIKTNTYFLLLETNEYVLSPDGEHAAEFKEAKKLLLRTIDSYEQAEHGDEEEEEIIKIKEGAASIIASGESILKLKDSGASKEIVIENIEELDTLAEKYFEILNSELFNDTVDLISSHKAVSNEVKDTLSITTVLTLVTLLIVVIVGFFVSHIIACVFRSNKINPKDTIQNDER